MAHILLPTEVADQINWLTLDLPKATRREVSDALQHMLGNSLVDRPNTLDKTTIDILTEGGKNSPLRLVKAAIDRMPKSDPNKVILRVRHRAVQKLCGA